MRSDAERFRDILEAIERIERYTGCRTGFGAAGDVLAPSRNRKFVKAIRSGPSRDQVRLLEFAREERSLTELMALFGASNRTKFRNKLVRPLIDAGWLSMTIPDKPRSSKQRYISTNQTHVHRHCGTSGQPVHLSIEAVFPLCRKKRPEQPPR